MVEGDGMDVNNLLIEFVCVCVGGGGHNPRSQTQFTAITSPLRVRPTLLRRRVGRTR